MKTSMIIVSASLSVLAVRAADIYYAGGDGVLSSSDAWTGGAVPGAGDRAHIKGSGNLKLTTAADFAAGCVSVYTDNAGPLSVDFNLGAFRWTGAGNSDYDHQFVVNGSAANPVKATLSGGAFSTFSMLSLGVNVSNYGAKEFCNTTVEITGTNTSFSAVKGDTQVGTSGTNNTLIVSDGAQVTSGRALVLGGTGCGNNLVRITDAGTKFVSKGTGDYNKFGDKGSCDNTVIVENGARFEQTTSSYFAIGNGNGASRNAFIVRDGAVVAISGAASNVQLGKYVKAEDAGMSDNRLIVSNAEFAANGIYVGGWAGSNNVVRISGGAVVRTQQHIQLGGHADAIGNELVVEGAGTVVTNVQYDLSVGKFGSRNRLRIADGAEVYDGRDFYVGGEANTAGACDNAVQVVGTGSVLRVAKYPYIGYLNATGNVLRVTDGGSFTNGAFTFTVGGVNCRSNAVEVSGRGSTFYVGNYGLIGQNTSACDNRFTVTKGAYAEFARGFAVGYANGTCSNVVEVLDGAVVDVLKDYSAVSSWQPYFSTGPANTDAKYDDASIVGNGIVVSNATLDCSGSARASELLINYRGTGGYLKAMDGAVVTPNQSFSLGLGSTNAAYGLIYAVGEGTVLSNKQYHLKVANGNNGGHDNTVWIDDGAKMYIKNQMYFGSDAVPSATNNCLKITNGGFYNDSSFALEMYNRARLVWGGSRSEIRVSTFKMTNDAEIDFVFDKAGIATFGPLYESYLLNNDWTPSVRKITVDATAYVKNPANKKAVFTLFKSVNSRNLRTQGGVELKAQSADTIAAVNQAFLDRIVCTPADRVRVTKVDMLTSTIEVEVKPYRGLSIIFR